MTTIVDDEWKWYLLNPHNHIETMQLFHPCVVDLCLIYLGKKLLQGVKKLSIVKHVASAFKSVYKTCWLANVTLPSIVDSYHNACQSIQ